WVICGGVGIAIVTTLYITPVFYRLLAPLGRSRGDFDRLLDRELEQAQGKDIVERVPPPTPQQSRECPEPNHALAPLLRRCRASRRDRRLHDRGSDVRAPGGRAARRLPYPGAGAVPRRRAGRALVGAARRRAAQPPDRARSRRQPRAARRREP